MKRSALLVALLFAVGLAVATSYIVANAQVRDHRDTSPPPERPRPVPMGSEVGVQLEQLSRGRIVGVEAYVGRFDGKPFNGCIAYLEPLSARSRPLPEKRNYVLLARDLRLQSLLETAYLSESYNVRPLVNRIAMGPPASFVGMVHWGDDPVVYEVLAVRLGTASADIEQDPDWEPRPSERVPARRGTTPSDP